MMSGYRIHTSEEIFAPGETVWKLVTELENYCHWNPFVVQAEGKAALGAQLKLHPRVSGKRQLHFTAVVSRCESGREFAWMGHVIHPWIACGEHIFQIEVLGNNHVRLIHDEVFSGLALPFIALFATKKTTEGFRQMNAALKQEAEKSVNS